MGEMFFECRKCILRSHKHIGTSRLSVYRKFCLNTVIFQIPSNTYWNPTLNKYLLISMKPAIVCTIAYFVSCVIQHIQFCPWPEFDVSNRFTYLCSPSRLSTDWCESLNRLCTPTDDTFTIFHQVITCWIKFAVSILFCNFKPATTLSSNTLSTWPTFCNCKRVGYTEDEVRHVALRMLFFQPHTALVHPQRNRPSLHQNSASYTFP